MLYPLARETLRFNLEHGVATFLKGPPGGGKTSMVRDEVADLGRPMVEETLGTMEAVDLRGLPNTDHANKVVWWSRPDFIDKLYQASEHGKKKPVLFIDEANANNQSIQVPLMQLVLEKRVGSHFLPEGTDIVLAGNRIKDRAAAQKTPTALNNRVSHVDVETCHKTWLKWAATSGLHPWLVGLIMFRGETTNERKGLLHLFDPTKSEEEAFPSPRSWAMANPWFTAPDKIREGGIASIVGEAGAREAEGFIQVAKELAPPHLIIADPKRAALPKNGATEFAVCVALANAANDVNFGNIITYVERIGLEYTAMTITDAIKRKPALCNTSAYINWSAEHQALLT